MDAEAACPACRAPAAAAQEYCLECGKRLVVPARRVHWLWPALVALVVAGGGAAIATATQPESTQTIVALSPLRRAPSAPAARGLAVWRRAQGFTIALATLPTERGLDPPRRRARQALRAGLRDVGLLESSSFASLHPGYYVVFAGIYATADDAQAALPRARRSFGNARLLAVSR